MAELKDRLEEAIDASPFDTKTAFYDAFAALAADRGVQGRSNPVFYRHLSGMGRQPSVEWLRVFAETAGVRWEWLATGDGVPTVAEERRRRALEVAREDAPDTWLASVIEEAAQYYYVGEWHAATWSVQALYNAALERCEDNDDVSAEQSRHVVFGLFRVLDAPVQHLGGSWDTVGSYLLTATGLYRMLLQSEPPSTVDELIGRLWGEYSPTVEIKSAISEMFESGD